MTTEKKKVAAKSKPKSTKVEKRTVILELDGKKLECDINEMLPIAFRKSKLKADQKYIPIGVYREIMRQIGEFGIPRITKTKFLSGNDKYGNNKSTYEAYTEIDWYHNKEEEPIVLKGYGYSAISAGALLSDAVHGNMMTLEAKSVRSALRHSYKIFELPEGEEEEEDTNEKGTITDKAVEQLKTEDTKKNAAQKNEDTKTSDKDTKTPDKDTKADDGIEEIKKKMVTAYNENYQFILKESGGDPAKVQKKDVLIIGTQMKEIFGEEHKDFIRDLLVDDFNKAK